MPIHLGIGAALRTGFRHAVDAGYDGAIQLDADGQHDPCEIRRILVGLADGADLVIGTRFDPADEVPGDRYLPLGPTGAGHALDAPWGQAPHRRPPHRPVQWLSGVLPADV